MSEQLGKNIFYRQCRKTGKTGFLSMTYPSIISSNDCIFHTAEGYVFYRKRMLFEKLNMDYNIENIRKFDKLLPLHTKINILYDGNLKKFTQNEKLREKLLETDPFFIEQISLGRNKYIKNNLLGNVLIDIRNELL